MSPTPPSLLRRLEQACLLLLLLTLALAPLVFYTQTQDQFELPKVLMVRALSAWILGGFVAWFGLSPNRRWRSSPLDLPLLAFSAWLGVKTVFSLAPWVSWRGEYENFAGTLTQLNLSLLFFLTVQFIRDADRARLLIRALFFGALGAALYGLLQACQRDLITWASESYINNRFFGSLGNPNFLAGLACMVIPLKIALAWEARLNGKRAAESDAPLRWCLLALGVVAFLMAGRLDRLAFWQARPGEDLAARWAILLWLAALPLGWALRRRGHFTAAALFGHGVDLLVLFKALANTGTRGGILGLLAGFGILALGWLRLEWRPDRAKELLPRLALGLLLGLAALSAGLYGLGPSFRQRVAATLKDPSQAIESSRLQIWMPALSMWRAHPLTGTGVDTFKSMFPRYSSSRFNRFDGENVSSRMAHSEPLQILATLGLVGLALWLWFWSALTRAWWLRLRSEEGALMVGLGALLAAYLAQNLVSFGVTGISVPFFMAAALLFAGDSPVEAPAPARPMPPRAVVLTVALGVALAGSLSAWKTLRADLDYAFGSQVHRQTQGAGNLGLEEGLSMAGFALQRLQAPELSVGPEVQAEHDLWLPLLRQWSAKIQAEPSAAATLRPQILRGAAALLYGLASVHLERATLLCPHEVKYFVYLGLAYEELFKNTSPDRRAVWFSLAEEAYRRSVELNPQNAYYHGNLGRLYGMGAEAGNEAYLAPAEENYLKALAIAPVTRLFYENLLLLYARYAKTDATAALMDRLEARDPELAPSVLIAGASTFYQWRARDDGAWTPALRTAALPKILDWAKRAVALAPKTFRSAEDQAVFGDYAFALAVFELESRHRDEARMAIAIAQEWKPDDPAIKEYKIQNGL